ncbi:hypothetical protein cyc_04438 [Cyclospora cayetanensis]|uniref:Uncharacterized protein n=1 Tax=Cyclospora cayetanensis TaxID=88456 RepID=A0A1D3CR43_9EIME|nr:hypothetical protein cyc_04438 [Cyclospora cayetanensis]
MRRSQEAKNGGVCTSPKPSRSLSVSSDSGEEPEALEEARRGSIPEASHIRRRSSKFARLASKSCPSRSQLPIGRPGSGLGTSYGYVASRSRRGALANKQRSAGAVSFCEPRDITSQRGSSSSHGSITSITSGLKPKGVSFVDELTEKGGTQTSLFSFEDSSVVASNEVSKDVRFKNTAAAGDALQAADLQGTESGDQAFQARAMLAASRSIAAMKADRMAWHETQTSAMDDVEGEVKGFHRQLDEVKDTFRRRCLGILNSLVGSKWTIDTGDSLAKRMLRPSKWSPKGQQQPEITEAQRESSTPHTRPWFGPSAVDVFGDSLVTEERNPYRIVGVFARRYWDTKQRLPFLDDLPCCTLLHCVQHVEPLIGRPQVLQLPFEPPRPIKAFPSSGLVTSPTPSSPPGEAEPSAVLAGSASAASVLPYETSAHPNGLQHPVELPRILSPPKGSSMTAEQIAKGREQAYWATRCPLPCSQYECVALPPVNITRGSVPASYPKSPTENNNMRIPSPVAKYLEKNCVRVERPKWDRGRQREPRKDHQSRFSARDEDTESSSDEAEKRSPGVARGSACELLPLLPSDVASRLPQLFKKEVGNRFMPVLFPETDVRITEYWKLENVKDKAKATWVYQGIHTGPKPYTWEEVPPEGKPLTRENIAQQRRESARRRRLSHEAELLLRGVGHTTDWDEPYDEDPSALPTNTDSHRIVIYDRARFLRSSSTFVTSR